MVEDLLEQAEISRDEIAEGREPLEKALDLPPLTVEDTVEWVAASTIQRFAKALDAIAKGADDPTEIAQDALDAGS